MGLGNIFAGALQGLGAGIAAKGQSDLAERKAAALEALRQQNAIALEDRSNANETARMKMQAEEQRKTQAYAAELDDWKDSRSNARSTSSQVKLEGVKAANQAALARLQSRLAISEEQAKQAKELSNYFARLGKEVGDYRVAADGSVWAFSKTGQVMNKTDAGTFNPPNPPVDPMTGLPAAAPVRQPAPAPAPRATSSTAPAADYVYDPNTGQLVRNRAK